MPGPCQTGLYLIPISIHLNLSSANSINIGRLLPAIVLLFLCLVTTGRYRKDEPVIFADTLRKFWKHDGRIAGKKMGLPVKRFVIATNENDEVPVYWQTGNYATIVPSRNCISSAMNVGHPSNMARVIALYGGIMDEKGNIIREPDIRKMRDEIFAVSISDKKTNEVLRETLHINMAFLLNLMVLQDGQGLLQYFRQHPADDNTRNQIAISLETAHPAKFPEEIQKLLGIDPALPASHGRTRQAEESYERLDNNYAHFKEYLVRPVLKFVYFG